MKPIQRLNGAFWFAVHNAIAHPLLLTCCAPAWRFHDWTAHRMSSPRPSKPARSPKDDDRTLWGVVANAGRLSYARKPRWAHVSDATGLGSTSSAELCRRFGFNPDEYRGGGAAMAQESQS